MHNSIIKAKKIGKKTLVNCFYLAKFTKVFTAKVFYYTVSILEVVKLANYVCNFGNSKVHLISDVLRSLTVGQDSSV